MPDDEKKKAMLRGLGALVEQHIENSPHLLRLRTVMRALATEMRRLSAAGESLAPLAATALEDGAVTLLAGDPAATRDDVIARLQTLARQGGIVTGGFCTVVEGPGEKAMHIHAEDRMKPGWALLAIAPLREESDKPDKPFGGVKKRVPPVIFGPPH